MLPLPNASGVAPMVLSTAETIEIASKGRHVTVLEALLLTPDTDSEAVIRPVLSWSAAFAAVAVKPSKPAAMPVIAVLLANPLVT